MAPESGSTSNASVAGGSSRCPILAMNRPSNAPFKPVISAIGIAISCEARMAVFPHHSFLQHAYMRLNRLRVDLGKQRIDLLPDRNKLDSMLTENVRQNSAARTIHRIHSKFKFGFRD